MPTAIVVPSVMRSIDGGDKWGNPRKIFGAFNCLSPCLLGLTLLVLAFYAQPASAVTSYTRQTGQPCATCHTAFPELTPFGRQFKLRGFTGGGTRCNDASGRSASGEKQIPFSSTVVATAGDDDKIAVQEVSLYLAGQLYCNIGSFIEASWDRSTDRFSLSDTDIRYAKGAKIGGSDVLYGLTLNNGPVSHDVWKTTPLSSLPVSSRFVNGAADTVLAEGTNEGAFQDRIIGLGLYGSINDHFFGEVAAYTSIDKDIASALGVAPSPSGSLDGVAPYWRFVGEYTLGQQTFMLGTFGMIMDVNQNNMINHVTDVGVDAMYQYTANDHRLTLKGRLSRENSSRDPSSTNLKLSGTYVYDRQWSFQAGYYTSFGGHAGTTGAAPQQTPARQAADPGESEGGDDDELEHDDDDERETVSLLDGSYSGQPGSGYILDIGYMPFNKDAPSTSPWATGRIGIQYNHSDADTLGTASDTAFAYVWIAF